MCVASFLPSNRSAVCVLLLSPFNRRSLGLRETWLAGVLLGKPTCRGCCVGTIHWGLCRGSGEAVGRRKRGLNWVWREVEGAAWVQLKEDHLCMPLAEV